MAFVFLDNICVTLTNAIDSGTRTLPISSSEKQLLIDKLGVDGFSYLTLSAGTGIEVVKVSVASNYIAMDRGQGGTTPIPASSGNCLCFRYNKLILDEYIKGIQEPCRVTIESDHLEVIEPEDDKCNWKINFTEEFIERLDNCCPDGDCPPCNVVDGTYENATVTIRNGRICFIQNGRNIVYTGGSNCGCQ